MEPFNNDLGDIVFLAEVHHIPVNQPEEVPTGEGMVWWRDVQLSDYFSDA